MQDASGVDAGKDAAAQNATTHGAPGSRAGLWSLALGSVGVVYGDIGTSPLYAFREALSAASGHTGVFTRDMVLGVVSLILWALILIVTIKYVLILLRMDNRGEGGTLTLMALTQKALGRSALIAVLGIAGAALFYGDAIITPAISVLSAVEGLKLVTPAFEGWTVPITVAILCGLFMVQSRGTAAVANWFGPITALFFLSMAAAGLSHIGDDPGVFAAFNPYYAVVFLSNEGILGLWALGAVFLAVTGAEALYADLGHFGRRPIQLAWVGLVLPCLALNYLGQGALVLANPAALENPFFLLVPPWAMLPMVLLATAATVIASQAVITGAFSLSRQAVQLGLLPRLRVLHTSDDHSGQIYVPQINVMLLVGVLVLVVSFGNSTALASAYGIAVTGTMVITAVMAFIVMHKVWGWSIGRSALIMVPFLVLELIFLAANLLKIHEGGWMPLALAAVIMVVMLTWRRGSQFLFDKTRKSEVPLLDLIRQLGERSPHEIQGTAVFLTADPESAPTALLHSLKHYKILHHHNVILTVQSTDEPKLTDDQKVTIEELSPRFLRVKVRFGYMETPNLPKALALCRKKGWKYDIMTTSFFLSRRSIRASAATGMPLWQDYLFIFLARNADDASSYFRLPTDRVVEVGQQITV